ncbi:hypothetical protein LINGRAHAP2_LOCUS29166 [Linum grandiflorum]
MQLFPSLSRAPLSLMCFPLAPPTS